MARGLSRTLSKCEHGQEVRTICQELVRGVANQDDLSARCVPHTASLRLRRRHEALEPNDMHGDVERPAAGGRREAVWLSLQL